MSDKLDALRALLARVEAGDHRVGMWRALINPLHPHAPEYARQAFLGSLDAAMALHKAVLTGWHFDVATEANGKGFYASISPKAWGSSFIVCSDSPARAWLIAIIMALIAIEEGKA